MGSIKFNKFHLHIQEGYNEEIALCRIQSVINLGLISEDNKPYCCVSSFNDKTIVITKRNKSGSYLFWVYKEKE